MPDTHVPPGGTGSADDERLNIGEAAAILEVDASTLRRWADSGYLRFSRVGPAGYRRFRRSDVEALAAKHRETAPAVDAS